MRTTDLEVGGEAQGKAPRRSDGFAGEETTEIDDVENIVSILRVELQRIFRRSDL
jgi:hypothetical protein